jgi:uncharacterized protein
MMRQLVVAGMLTLLRGYKRFLSPLLPPACRYLPTCSDYAQDALRQHGPLRGGWLATKRLCRCHPWGGHGYDPVPGTQTETDQQPATETADAQGDSRPST